jgi:hypothetical protein
MRLARICLAMAFLMTSVIAQEKPSDGPNDEKAKKTYEKVIEDLHIRNTNFAAGTTSRLPGCRTIPE